MLGIIYSISSLLVIYPFKCDTTYVDSANKHVISKIICYHLDSLNNIISYENDLIYNQRRIFHGYMDSNNKFIKNGCYTILNKINNQDVYDTAIFGNYVNNLKNGEETHFATDSNSNNYISSIFFWEKGRPTGIWEVFYPGVESLSYLKINWKSKHNTKFKYSQGNAKYFFPNGEIKCKGTLGYFSYPLPDCIIKWFCMLPENNKDVCERFLTPVGRWQFNITHKSKKVIIKFPSNAQDFFSFKIDCAQFE